MYKLFFYHIALFILSPPVSSCAYKGNDEQSDESFKVCKIVIVSPYGCFQEIEFTNKGVGTLKSGLKNGSITDEDVTIDSVLTIDSFFVQKKQHVQDLNSYIDSVLKKDNIKGAHKTDTYRFKVFIDDISKIDVYGGSVEVHKILGFLLRYLPLSNDRCEFFGLFKKSIS